MTGKDLLLGEIVDAEDIKLIIPQRDDAVIHYTDNTIILGACRYNQNSETESEFTHLIYLRNLFSAQLKNLQLLSSKHPAFDLFANSIEYKFGTLSGWIIWPFRQSSMVLREYAEERGPLSWEDALTIWFQVAEAVAIYKKENISGLDPSPDNLLITDEYRIKWIAPGPSDNEFWRSASSRLDKTSDLWCLAGLLVYLLTGAEGEHVWVNKELIKKFQTIPKEFEQWRKKTFRGGKVKWQSVQEMIKHLPKIKDIYVSGWREGFFSGTLLPYIKKALENNIEEFKNQFYEEKKIKIIEAWQEETEKVLRFLFGKKMPQPQQLLHIGKLIDNSGREWEIVPPDTDEISGAALLVHIVKKEPVSWSEAAATRELFRQEMNSAGYAIPPDENPDVPDYRRPIPRPPIWEEAQAIITAGIELPELGWFWSMGSYKNAIEAGLDGVVAFNKRGKYVLKDINDKAGIILVIPLVVYQEI